MTETANTEALRGELEQRAAPKETKTILDLLERQKPEIEKLLPRHVTAERFVRTVLTELRRTPKLYECSPESLLGALMLSVQLGLEPGPLDHVHLVPFKGQVEFIVGYRGYVELALQSGLVKDVFAALVHDGDLFEYEYGTQPKLRHKPSGPSDEREIVAAYAVARLKSGGAPFVVTYEPEWERARKASAAGSKGLGPWVDDRPAMIRKTALRRLEPWLPKTRPFAVAFEHDELPAEPIDEAPTVLA